MAGLYSFTIKLNDMFSQGFAKLNAMIGSSNKGFGDLAGRAFAFNQLGQAMQGAFDVLNGPIQKAGALSDAMAIVQKNTGATTAQMTELKKVIDGIDTRTSTLALLDMASVGGKLGVPIAELKGFVKVVDMANVALGDEFGGNAEVVATHLAKIKNQFSEFKSTSWEESLMRIGSSINALGKIGANSAPNIMEFAKRFSAVGMSFSQSIGIGASLEELGMDAERGASGIKNIIDLMAKDTSGFAKHLGVDAKAFAKIVDTDVNKALIMFLNSMKSASRTQNANVFKELKIGNQETSDAVGKLAKDIDKLTTRQKNANDALKAGTDIQTEFALMNETLGAKLDKAKKRMDSVATAIGGLLAPYAPLIQTTGMLTMSFMQLAPVLSSAWAGLMSLGQMMIKAAVQTAIFTGRVLFQSAVLAGQFVFSLFSAATYTNLFTKAQRISAIASTLFTKALFVSGAAISMIKTRIATMSFAGFISGMRAMAVSAAQSSMSMLRSAVVGIAAWVTGLGAATFAQWGLNVAMYANPIGLVIAGILALAAAVWVIVNNWDIMKVWLIEFGAFMFKMNPFGMLLTIADMMFPGLIAKLKEWGGVVFTWLESLWGKLKEIWDIIAPALGLGDISIKTEQLKLPDWAPTQDKGQGTFATGLDIGGTGEKATKGGVSAIGNGVVSGQPNIQSSQPKNITINIGSLVQGGITISSTTVNEGAAKIKDIITEQFLAAVNDVNLMN